MRFCPQCGAPVVSGARFCVECGEPLERTAPADAGAEAQVAFAAAPAPGAPAPALSRYTTRTFLAVFAVILVGGLAAAALVVRGFRQQDHARGEQAAQNLPSGHPPIKLPDEARKFIADLDRQAESRPGDVATWERLGDVALRAALFDPSYYALAERAYAHLLKLNPDELDALRGIGDIDYDLHRYDQAIAAYEHYLDRKGDDAEVRTDLGTMYLSTGNSDLALAQYKKAISLNPRLFQAYYNMGVAYGERKDKADARDAFLKALALAPNDTARNEVRQMLATLGVSPAASAEGASAAVASKPATFKGSVEEMVRDLPIAGSKVASVQWPARYRARVLMIDFPMDKMPPFAAAKFVGDLKDGLRQAKAAHKVTDPVEVEIVDGATGRVMQTVTE